MQKNKAWAVAAFVALTFPSAAFALPDFSPRSQDLPAVSEPSAIDALEADDTDMPEIVLELNDSRSPVSTAYRSSALKWIDESRELIQIAKCYLGVPYKWGGTTPSAFDCSGFTRYVYAKIGIQLPRTAREQYRMGMKVPPGKWRSGDLVFFDMNKGYVSHVGMYLADKWFIHASNPKSGVKMDSLEKPVYKRNYVGACRYLMT